MNNEITVSSPASENVPSSSIPPIHPENIALQSTLATPDVISRIERVLPPLKKIADINVIKGKEQRYIDQTSYTLRNQTLKWYILSVPISLVCMWLIMNRYNISNNRSIGYLVGIIIGFIITTLAYMYTKKSKEKAEQKVADCLSAINDVCKEIDRNDIVVIPPAYRYFSAASFFFNAFINQRALTMQQAVNLYEEELHNNKMEQMQQANMQMLMQQNRDLRSIKRNSSVAATMSSLTYIEMLFK